MIRPELLSILACPNCFSPHLRQVQNGEEALVCDRCGHRYGFEHNIPLLYKDDEFWAPKRREALGWVSMWKEIGLYEDPAFIPELPFISDEPWATIARMFRAALFQMDLRGGERILDIGAGEGCACQYFAQKGCHAVAIDIVPDPKLGLGRAWRRMNHTGTIYDLLIGDNERLPFQPNTFDFVFSSNTLHHSEHLDRTLANVYRVLRPGGRLIAIGDPVRTIFQKEDDVHDGEREKSHGIIEKRRRFYEYLFRVWRAGFHNIHWEDADTFWQTNAELYPWLDQQRQEIEQHPLLGSMIPTKALTYMMLRLPRPFAVALLLSLRWSNLMISGQKPA